MKRIDFTNKIINDIKILNISQNNTRYGAIWKCLCLKCNNEIFISSKNLNRSLPNCNSCNDLTGRKFGINSTVVEYVITTKKENKWRCICGCGREVLLPKRKILCNQKGCDGCRGTGIFFSDSDEKRRTVKYQNLIKSVYLRDNYTCQSCGTSKGRFNCHHLYAWKSHPDKRFDIDNCVTLCLQCHKNFHKIYGKGLNTPEQFNEFKNENPDSRHQRT